MPNAGKIRLWIISAMLAVILLGLGFGIGYLLHGYMAPEEAYEKPREDIAAQSVAQVADTVSTTAKVERVIRFLYCGHDLTRAEDAKTFVGMDENGVRNSCGEWALTFFSRERVVLTDERNAYCPDHLVLRIDGEGLGVFRTDPQTAEEVRITHFETSVEQLPAEARQRLAEGMPFENLTEIEAYLEDMES